MFATLLEMESFIADFETCRLPKSGWTHQAHFVVGLWYLSRNSSEAALVLVRQRIRTYNESVGVANTDTSGYHETLTRLFLEAIAAHHAAHRALPLTESLAELLRSPVLEKNWPLNFYTPERLFSVAARRDWVTPDR